MDLLARARELKPELVHYATSGRFQRELTAVLDRFYAGGRPQDEANAFLPVDYFVHQHKLGGGGTVVDRFVHEHPGLDAADHELLLSWKDVVEGVFEVTGFDGPALILFNHVDELTYRTLSNLGEEAFAPLAEGMFVVGRLIPLGRDWLISATPSVHTAQARGRLVAAAAHVALENPAAAYRNPDLLAAARRTQAEQRRCFISYFGSDQVVVAGAEVAAKIQGYLGYQAERLGGRVDAEIPEHVSRAGSVALIFDETDGLGYYAEFARLAEIFDRPGLVARREGRDLVTSYLKGDAVSPVPIVRLAERDHAKAGELFAGLLGRPGFLWERSGQALLRTHKPGYFDGPRLPTVVPPTRAVAEHTGG
ncbi:hypothetical protein ACIBHY_47435 [Nonomuraea sp. NPDC050547]|uniref:hypothetical protein n=1 Tax=Nonomuraea sp. NPDC050547 TaxID=3364368 RepID=UPI0037A5A745